MVARTAVLLALQCLGLFCAIPLEAANLSAAYQDMLNQYSNQNISNDERHERLKVLYESTKGVVVDPASASEEDLVAALTMSEAMLVAELGYSKPSPHLYVSKMSNLFKELVRRGTVSKEVRDSMIGAYLSVWEVDEANKLLTDGTRVKQGDAFVLENQDARTETGPAFVIFSNTDNTASASFFRFPKGPMVIVSAGCHIARRAAESIAADSELSAAFREANAIWLSAASLALNPSDVRAWNNRFPESPMHVALNNSEWEDVDFARLPSFHFFFDGKLVAQVNGWSDAAGAIDKVWSAFGEIGVRARQPTDFSSSKSIEPVLKDLATP